MHLKRLLIASLLILGFTSTLSAQVALDYYLPKDTKYDSAVPTPQSWLGFQVGEWHVRHDLLAGYMKALAAASDRVTIVEYARSYEHRPLLLLTITSPENQQNIEKIKADHLLLSDPERSGEVDLSTMPVFVWMGYSVHGNEPSGSNASLAVAYHLAAAQGPEIERQLKDAVILMDPSINPDGLGRFAHWANMHKSKNLVADPDSREHREGWPSGRTNHYWFDLNRDWMPVQHPESQGRIKKFHEWKPNVVTDHHEMGTNSTYFFQPGVPSRNHPMSPKRTFELTTEIAKYHARALDKIGSLYYMQENFDDFYYGKGSTYPDVNGAVGILFEQASSRGHVQESINGRLTFPFTIRNQVTTSFSTLNAALDLRKELLEHQRTTYTGALKKAKTAPVKAYVVGSPKDPARTHALLKILRTHKITVHKLARSLTANGITFNPETSFIVPSNQKQFRFLTALLEKRTTFTDSLFYDISAWSLPLAFNLQHAELKSNAYDPGLLGAAVDEPQFPQGTQSLGNKAYGYAFEWHGYFAPRALYRLLSAGINARVATSTFSSQTQQGEHHFDYGTIVVPVGIQPEKADEIRALFAKIATEDGIDVFSLSTGLRASGIDLGSPSFHVVKKPKVMLVTGNGASSYDVGEAWHLFDQRYDMDVSMVETTNLSSVDLRNYTAIVLSNGRYSTISKKAKAALKSWVQQGGTLVAVGGAARWAAANKLATVDFKKTKRDSLVKKRPYNKASSDNGAQVVGGAIVEAEIDLTHPVAWGYQTEKLAIFRRGTMVMKPSKNKYATPVRYTDSPLLSGYISKENQNMLPNAASVVVSGNGRGRVILMADNPNFRAFWYGTNKLFANAVFFGSAISGRTTR